LALWAQYQRADLAAADNLLTEMENLAEAVGLPHQRWQVALSRVGRTLLAGDANEAETANEQTLELGSAAGAPEALGVYGGLLYTIRQHQGRFDEITDLFAAFARDNPSISVLRAAVPLMLCESGRTDEAHTLLAADTANGFDIPFDMSWLTAMSTFTDAVATIGDKSAASILVERIAPYANHIAAPGGAAVAGAIARPLARAATLLGDYEKAEKWFTIAHELHGRLHAPFFTALGQLDHASLCLTRRAEGDLALARQLATTAATTAAEYGCGGLTRRADSILASL